MRLKPVKTDPEDTGDDEEMSENDSQEHESQEDETEEDPEEDPEEEQEEEQVGDAADSELSDEESSANANHPYPTPPPDTEANMSLGNGFQKVKISKVKSKTATGTKSKMASPKKAKPAKEMNASRKLPLIKLSLDAINGLGNRSGSSVDAIVKYLKSNGYNMTDERRTRRLIYKVLKDAVTKGQVVQIKNSFKLSEDAKKSSKAMEKMKAKQEKQKAKEKEKELKAKERAMAKEKEKSEKKMLKNNNKRKPTERKTKEPRKKKASAKLAAVAVDDKMPNEEPTEELTPVTKTKVAAPASATPKGKSNAKTRTKPVRKSIGTLARGQGRIKLQPKSIKKLVSVDNIESDNPEAGQPLASTPLASPKQKRKQRKI